MSQISAVRVGRESHRPSNPLDDGELKTVLSILNPEATLLRWTVKMLFEGRDMKLREEALKRLLNHVSGRTHPCTRSKVQALIDAYKQGAGRPKEADRARRAITCRQVVRARTTSLVFAH